MLPSIFRRVRLSRTYQRITPLINNKNSKRYFTITLSLFSLSFFGLFAIRPTLITAVSLNKSVADLKKLNIEYENKISTIILAQAKYEEIRDGISAIDNAIPHNASFNQLANTLEEYASRSNINLKQVQIDKAPISQLPPSGKLNEVMFSVLASGDYPSTSGFFQHLLNWKRLITIDKFELAKEGGTQSAILRISLKGKTYYEP